ncbi:MAG: hypothetical protein LBQ33_01015 [Oscillospiraceae bacterium]|nr:hypothetical protein [Oscillospiraceae bacterium]
MKHRRVLTAFTCLLLGGLLPLRLYQTLYQIEPVTGFWRVRSYTEWLLYAGVALLIVFPLVYATAARKQAVLELGSRHRWAEGVFAALAGVALAIDAVASLQLAQGVYRNFVQGIYLTGMEMENGSSALQYFIRSGTLAAAMECVFGAVSALFFAGLALLDFKPRKNGTPGRLLLLAPLLWGVCRILRRFARTISYLQVSDLFLELLLLACLLMFFLTFAQVLSGINGEGKESRLFAAGIPAAVLGLVCFVPRLVMRLLGRGAELSQDAPADWCLAALPLFILVFLGGRLLFGKTAAKAAPAFAPAAAAESAE